MKYLLMYKKSEILNMKQCGILCGAMKHSDPHQQSLMKSLQIQLQKWNIKSKPDTNDSTILLMNRNDIQKLIL